MDFSLIVPCYNEEGNLEKFYEEAEKVFSNANIEYEYVFINDGSTDNSEKILKKIYNEHPNKNITIVNFSRNFGKESAIFAGLKNSEGDAVCLIDADLQQLPQTAFDMYKILVSNPELDCVCAYQSQRRESKAMATMKSLFYKVMNSMVETNFKNGASDFRVFRTSVKEAILSLGEFHRFSKGIFSWVGFNTEYIEYEACERNSGETKWGFKKLLKYAFTGIIAFSTAPLQLSTYLGVIATIFSFIYFVVTIIRKLALNIHVDGFAQLVILISFFSGVILITVGTIGIYIAKIYQQVKNRPIYVAKEILKRDKKDFYNE